MKPAQRRRRGSATVELAVTMVVVIPLTMYTLFLEDYTSYYLDWQEAIVSSPWDATAFNFENKLDAPDGQVGHNNRLEFCDHTSAYTSYTHKYECNARHHKALTAHQCWLVNNTGNGGNGRKGKQVSCKIDDSAGNLIESLVYAREQNRGGLVSCTAALGVQNYFIIHNFLTPGSSSKHPNMLAIGGNQSGQGTQGVFRGEEGRIHSNANLGWGWVMGAEGTKSEDHFGMIVDPWAVNTVNDHEPHKSSPKDDFKKRVDMYFKKFAAIPGVRALAFGAQLANKDLIGYQTPLVDMALIGDNPMTDTLTWNTGYKREYKGHYASGFNDRQDSDYGNRKNFYLSQDESVW